VSYRTPLEARLAKKVTRAIVEHSLIEDGDRVMVGLSGKSSRSSASARPSISRSSRST